MGRMPHPEFRAAWERKVDGMEAEDITIAKCTKTLFRMYLPKISDDLRCTV